MMEGKRLRDMTVGETAAFTKTVSEADVYGFAGITGDFNPMHVNAVHAAASRFERRIAHGILSAGLISAVLGMQLPGAGAIYVSQSLRFLAPVYLGDTITAEVEVVELIAEKNRVRLATRCRNQDGVTVAEGESVLLPRKA